VDQVVRNSQAANETLIREVFRIGDPVHHYQRDQIEVRMYA
jgi:hypothetical protein